MDLMRPAVSVTVAIIAVHYRNGQIIERLAQQFGAEDRPESEASPWSTTVRCTVRPTGRDEEISAQRDADTWKGERIARGMKPEFHGEMESRYLTATRIRFHHTEKGRSRIKIGI